MFRSSYHATLAALLCATNAVTYYWFQRFGTVLPTTLLESEHITHSKVQVSLKEAGGSRSQPSSVYPSCCRLAYKQTYGLIDDVPNKAWLKYYQNPSLNPRMYRNDSFPDEHANNHGS
jgi:hypothetical protein